MNRKQKHWICLIAALGLAIFGGVRADAATVVSADLNPAEGDQPKAQKATHVVPRRRTLN